MASILTPSCFISLLLLLLLLSTTPLPASSSLCNKDDKKALLAFMNGIGPGFPSWTPKTACCDWDGVECDATGRIYGIDIFGGDLLLGPIPPSIGDLPTLQVLRLHKLSNLAGNIPPQITKLTRLRFLTISWTNISGPVPAFLADLPSLTNFDLSFNNLSGTIPTALGNHPKLTGIDISRNHLTGTIPPSLLQNARSATLILSHNQLSGTIPASFGTVDFVNLDLSRNQLTGDASFLFGPSKGLEQIILSRNQLKFDLTTVVFPDESGEDFIQLDLSHNMIYGSISKTITQAPNLQFLNVSYNRLCGEIPTGGQMGRFDEYCFFHNKCLCGTPLPACK